MKDNEVEKNPYILPALLPPCGRQADQNRLLVIHRVLHAASAVAKQSKQLRKLGIKL
jgi:hypothetical protein